jgi:hypothetical protein
MVIAQILGIEQASSEQWEMLREGSHIWHPDKMPPEYGELWTDVVQLMLHRTGLDLETLKTKERDNFYLGMRTLFGLLADISCAHPSPELLSRLGAERYEYEPGLRFLRLLSAMARMPDEYLDSFTAAAFASDLERAEAILLEYCVYPYASVREVYDDWLARFDDEEDARWPARLRADACRIRLKRPGAWVEKSLAGILQEEMYFMVMGPDGVTSLAQRWEHLDPEVAPQIFLDITGNAMELGLTDYFFETGRFGCPLATSKTCGSAGEACRDGIRLNSAFPPAPGCEVRDWLQKSGFNLGGIE